MRSIRNITLALGILFSVSLAQAQDKTLLQTEVMAKQLSLNDQQKSALDRELKAQKADREATQEKLKAFQEEIKRDIFVKQQEREAKLKSILTPEQFTKMQELRKAGKVRQTRAQRGQGQRRQFQGNARRFQGQGRGSAGFGRGFQRQGLQRRSSMKGLRATPEKRQELRKKFQEFLEQEKLKNGNGGN